MIKQFLQALKQKRQRKTTQASFERAYLDFMENPTRFTDQSAQSILRKAYVRCGRSALEWARGIQLKKTPHAPKAVSSAHFPLLTSAEIDKAVCSLGKDGYYVMPWRLTDSWVAAVREKAGEYPVKSREDAGDVQMAHSIAPKSHTYWHGSDIINVPELREFCLDAGINEVIGRYLGCRPVLDMVASWWTFPAGEASSDSAQLYHFDLDRIKWIKAFVYLSDVGPTNGPHAYVRGSHLDSMEKLGRDGRFSDTEVFSKYPTSDEVVFTGPAGTVILEDTLGLHKGVPAQEGYRFIFEFECSINHFGYPYPPVLT